MSGVYIDGMEMPTKEHYLTITIWPDGGATCWLRDRYNKIDALDIATAIPVPDHGRLIDADEFCTEHRSLKLLGRVGIRRFNWHVVAAAFVEDTPTIIPASTTDKEEEK